MDPRAGRNAALGFDLLSLTQVGVGRAIGPTQKMCRGATSTSSSTAVVFDYQNISRAIPALPLPEPDTHEAKEKERP